MTPTAVLFPGQGSLTADSGEHARAVHPDLVQRACELAGDDPFARAADSTRYAQPAIFVASLAGWTERKHELADDVTAMAGHSLGELSALVAAGALPAEDGLRLVVLRGELMADAAAASQDGGMVALLGGSPATAQELAASHDCTIANDNAPGQLVVSGSTAAIEELLVPARATGFKTMVLDVAGAFHSPAMAVVEKPFREALEEVEWTEPRVPVVSGLTAERFRDIPRELARALVSPVRWREVMATLFALGARDFVDVGPGRVLQRLAARNLMGLEADVLVR
jgi:malonyl CoA-acyl carrier protein transacylase